LDTKNINKSELKIISITKLEKREDTYCFNEPKKHRGIFNGILTGNCSEIMEYSSKDEYAVCCLASVCLPQFVEDTWTEDELNLPEDERRVLDHEFPQNPKFNYKKLIDVCRILVVNLNKLIEKNFYPVIETKISNMRHRPIGIGVQGLADVFSKFKIPFESKEAEYLNKKIFECMYYSALTESTTLAKEAYFKHIKDFEKKGELNIQTVYYKNNEAVIDKIKYVKREDIPFTVGAYQTFNGSPLSQGKFHWELFGLTKDNLVQNYDWETLRIHIKKFGVRNSLHIALMPTASTSQIMGNIEGFEPYKSNLYRRRTLAGDFILINKYLMNDLQKLNLWNKDMEDYLKLSGGSIQHLNVPQQLKELYKTVWEIKQKTLIDLAVGRQPFIDQSQSLNLHIPDLTYKKFNSIHFYSWKNNLKTGCYYMRTKPSFTTQKFSVDPTLEKKYNEMKKETNNNTQINLESYSNNIYEENENEMCLLCGS
jgi:ribonucleoside-diphosphate reductase alpha chain